MRKSGESIINQNFQVLLRTQWVKKTEYVFLWIQWNLPVKTIYFLISFKKININYQAQNLDKTAFACNSIILCFKSQSRLFDGFPPYIGNFQIQTTGLKKMKKFLSLSCLGRWAIYCEGHFDTRMWYDYATMQYDIVFIF